MQYSYRIEQAIRAAAVLHKDQVRKGQTPYPYVVHLFSVACILADYTDDEDIIIAGLLHDTIEDTDYTPEELETDFGPRVRDIVLGVTESKGETWKERKASYLKVLKGAPVESFMVAAADKIHNLRSVVEDYHEDAEGYLRNFGGTLDERLNHYTAFAALLKESLQSDILREFEHVFNEYRNFIAYAKADTK